MSEQAPAFDRGSRVVALKDKNVLVTGADGFIGSHLVERLVQEGAKVRAFVFYNSLSKWGWVDQFPSEISEAIEVFPGDIRDSGRVEEAARGSEVIFHLAALISIPYSYQSPESFVQTNVVGTLNVLNAARRLGGIKVINTSTSEVYGTPDTVPIQETHALKGQSPYAASKIAADKLAESFFHTYDLPIVILRPFNTYGPRQSARAVIPAILGQLLAGKSEVHVGALWPRRDLTFVDDTVAAFLRAAEEEGAVGKTVHLGTGRDISIRELAELAIKMLGASVRIVSSSERLRPAKSEVQRLLSDPSLAKELLRWSPVVGLEEGLRRTAGWMEKSLDEYKVHDYVV